MSEGPLKDSNTTEPSKEAVETDTRHVEVIEEDGSGILRASAEEAADLEEEGIFSL